MDFKDALRFVSKINPNLNIEDAISFSEQLHSMVENDTGLFNVDNRHDALVRLVWNTPEIVNELKLGNTIAAVKMLRDLSITNNFPLISLKEGLSAVNDVLSKLEKG
jgi:hypothetical protein